MQRLRNGVKNCLIIKTNFQKRVSAHRNCVLAALSPQAGQSRLNWPLQQKCGPERALTHSYCFNRCSSIVVILIVLLYLTSQSDAA